MEPLVSFAHQQPVFRGSIIKEYLLVAVPEADTRVQLEAMQEKLKSVNNVSPVLPPHLMLARFLAKEEMEETILRWMHRIISTQERFIVDLNNYGSIPGSRTLFLRVQDPSPFGELARQMKVIDELVRNNGLPKAQLSARPGLVLAEQLPDASYEKIIAHFSRAAFHASFEVSALLLYRRTTSIDEPKQITRFELQPNYYGPTA